MTEKQASEIMSTGEWKLGVMSDSQGQAESTGGSQMSKQDFQLIKKTFLKACLI